jgi:prepilin-type N-terminal cleavage/methylation domain-containing protein
MPVNPRARAFSLIEILVAVIVITILAAVVVPNSIRAGDITRVTETGEDLTVIAKAVEAYRTDPGRWPRGVNRAILPPELAEFFTRADPFQKTASVGGVHDHDDPTSTRGPGVTIRAGTGNPMADDSTILELAWAIDDGNVSSGPLRREGAPTTHSIANN